MRVEGGQLARLNHVKHNINDFGLEWWPPPPVVLCKHSYSPTIHLVDTNPLVDCQVKRKLYLSRVGV